MAKGLDAGKAFLEGILSKITDPEEKAAAQRLLANQSVVTEIGNGVVGQAEIDRQLQALRTQQTDLEAQTSALSEKETKLDTWHQQLSGWGAENQELIALGKKAKAGTTVIPPTTTTTPPAGLTEEQFNQQIANERSAFVGFSLEQNQVQKRHFDTFGQMLDIEPLLRHPSIKDVGIKGVYELVHKDALAAKATELATAAENRIRADERAKVLASSATMPYPIQGSLTPGSPLDSLKPSAGNDGLVDAATAEYARLQAARNGAPA